jgi:ankyrin repeat protein
MNKLIETNSVYDELLFSKNNDGKTCFHMAVAKGYFNLVEYFIKVSLSFAGKFL